MIVLGWSPRGIRVSRGKWKDNNDKPGRGKDNKITENHYTRSVRGSKMNVGGKYNDCQRFKTQFKTYSLCQSESREGRDGEEG